MVQPLWKRVWLFVLKLKLVEEEWQPTLVFLPGKSHGQRSQVGISPWGHKESDTTEHPCTHSQLNPGAEPALPAGLHLSQSSYVNKSTSCHQRKN